jgi:hypothetical protein
MTDTIKRFCQFCGRELVGHQANANFCDRACYEREWHAIKMLEGTHGYVSGQWTRLKVA